jgi:hypothetical protein
MIWLYDFLWTIFHPQFFLMNHPYSAEWEKQFNELLSQNSFTNIDHYNAFLGDKKLWVASYPFACFTTRLNGFPPECREVRPKRRTIYRAWQKIKEDWQASVLIPKTGVRFPFDGIDGFESKDSEG